MSGSEPEQPPKYTKYRARRNPFKRDAGLRADAPATPPGAPPADPDRPYAVHGRTRRPWQRTPKDPHAPGRRITKGRIAKYVALAIVAWLGLSLAVFLLSAQIQQGKIDDRTEQALDGGGLPLGSATTVLVLGSDQRSDETAEPGASTSGPSRSDSIMLLRVGGGANSRLSIARDTIVDIPGGGRQKINAAYAIGGASLAIQTVKQFLGIEVNHVIEVSFSEFPDLIDAMGGIDYKGGCVVAKVNGGYKNGGVTIRIKAGETEHLNGKQALALARVQERLQQARERPHPRAPPAADHRRDAQPRARRHPAARLRIAAMNLAVGGTPETNVLGTVDGNVSDQQRTAAVEQFLDG